MDLKPFIDRIVTEIGPRPPGSRGELSAAEFIAAEMRKFGADVSLHETRVCPGMVHNLINLLTTVNLVSVLLYPFVPLGSAVLSLLLTTALLLSRIIGNRAIDWMFRRGRTRNVIGTFRPRGEAKRLLIFSGHHDSPNMMPLFWPPYKRYVHIIEKTVTYASLMIIPAGIIRTLYTGLHPSFPPVPGWYDVLYAVALSGFALNIFYRKKMISSELNLGANDNLSAVSVLVGLAHHLKSHRPENTLVRLISFGSEEALSYGAEGYARDFHEDVKRGVNINMETLGAGTLAVISKERMTMTAYTPEVVDFITRAGERAGVPLKAVEINYGGTDSYAFIKNGGRSACIFGMDETGLFSLWHSPLDNTANIDENNLQKALAVCIEAIRMSDEDGRD